jgi:hypothetical protein
MSDKIEGTITERASENTTLSSMYGNYLQKLPATRSLPMDLIADFDAEEGIHPTAAERVSADPRKSIYEIMFLVCVASIFMFVLIKVFPWGHMIPPSVCATPIGTQTHWVTDEDVRERGGVKKLTHVEKALYRISKLRTDGRLFDARNKASDYINNITSNDDHEKWMPVWHHYLEILDLRKENGALVSESRRLKELVPDSPLAVYYFVKSNLDEVRKPDFYKKKERKSISKNLTELRENCESVKASLLEKQRSIGEGEKDPWLDGFRLLLADIFRRQWWFSEFSWDDDSRELSFKYLGKLPGDSRQASEMRLSLLLDCESKWRQPWYKNPKTRVIDGCSITRKNLQDKIEMERNILKEEAI